MANTISHKALFSKLRDETVICKSTDYAHWTLPQLMADFTSTGGRGQVVVERDYQEMGALLTNHLASKLARLLFPTANPFFRVAASAEIERIAAEAGVAPDAMQSGLARLEMDAARRLFLNSSYAQLTLALKHLIVTGNVLIHRDSANAKCTTFGLQSFAIRRDGRGTPLDIVLREFTYVEALPEEVQNTLKSKDRVRYSRPEQQVEVYTRIQRKIKEGTVGHEVTEEVDTTKVGEGSWYPEHLCPWFSPTWSIIPGEHYGRGMVEDYAGGFAKLSDMSESAALYSVEMMRVVHLVSAASGTDIDDLAKAETGEYIRGDANSVAAHESGDAVKLQQASAEIDRTFTRLAKAFMYQGNTRDAERVTAYELQLEAQEAENALGGVYSSLSQGLQVPLAHVLMVEAKPDVLAGLISGDVKLDVIAGIPALGRTSDVQNLMMASQEIAAVVPITQLDSRISPTKVVDMIMHGRSVDTEAIYYTKKEQAEIAQAQQEAAQGQQQMMQAAGVADATSQLNQLQGAA